MADIGCKSISVLLLKCNTDIKIYLYLVINLSDDLLNHLSKYFESGSYLHQELL